MSQLVYTVAGAVFGVLIHEFFSNKKTIIENTVAISQLTVEIKNLKELISPIPELQKDVNGLGEKVRRMESELKET